MLDKLIISKSSARENTRLHRLLVSTFIFVTSLFSFGLVYSLFSQNIVMGSDSLNISALIDPPAVPENKPVEPRIKEQQTRSVEQTDRSTVTTRKENILRTDEHPIIPTSISTTKPINEARPNIPFSLGSIDKTRSSWASDSIAVGSRCSDCSSPVGSAIGGDDNTSQKTITKPKDVEPVGKPPEIKKPATPPIVSIGVVNSVAKNLVTPAYPAPARVARIDGSVTVQVLIDEEGRVISASAVNGHPLLRDAAVRAARSSTFTPTLLSKVPVKARGLIVYNFKR